MRFTERRFSPNRALFLLTAILGPLALAYIVWSPGTRIQDGRHDLNDNAIWLQHGWLGDDAWFERYDKDTSRFRDELKVKALAQTMKNHGIMTVFPHLCPCAPSGRIAEVDHTQTERFLDHFEDFKVIPWIGGVYGQQAVPERPQWRNAFVQSAVALLERHPRLAGVQINIEPMPSGNDSFLYLLEELKAAMPDGKILSVAAYPPPTRWHPFPDVHWEEAYYREVAKRSDQMAPMMYDTSLKKQKLYHQLMASWTEDVLEWAEGTPTLLGLPAYEDAGVGYHDPKVENLQNALRGIHAGLLRYDTLPTHYQGTAIYCEWEMTDEKWRVYKSEFESLDAAR